MHVMPAALVCSTSLLRIASWGLQHRDAANCQRVGKEGLRVRYPVGHGLQHIVVANCQLVSEEGLQARNAGCLGWQRMDAANCQLVSKEGLQALYPIGPDLHHIGVTNCQLVSEEGLQARILTARVWQRMEEQAATVLQGTTPSARPSRLCPARPCRAMRRPTCRLA